MSHCPCNVRVVSGILQLLITPPGTAHMFDLRRARTVVDVVSRAYEQALNDDEGSVVDLLAQSTNELVGPAGRERDRVLRDAMYAVVQPNLQARGDNRQLQSTEAQQVRYWSRSLAGDHFTTEDLGAAVLRAQGTFSDHLTWAVRDTRFAVAYLKEMKGVPYPPYRHRFTQEQSR